MTAEERAQGIRSRIEASIRAETFRLTDVLNWESGERYTALQYLHGRGNDRRPQQVRVKVLVTSAIVKNLTMPIRIGKKTRYMGGSARPGEDVMPDGVTPLRTVWEPRDEPYELTTEEATPLLIEHGEGVTRVMIRPAPNRQAWCREIAPTPRAPLPAKKAPERSSAAA